MDTIYLKNYAIWLGGAIALDWILSQFGGLEFLYSLLGPLAFFSIWIFILAGTITGTIATHKALGKNIEFGKAVVTVLTIVGGLGIIKFLVYWGDFGYLLTYIINFLLIDLVIAVSVVLATGTWYMFVKAGKPGWAMLIPIYNLVVMCEIAKKPGWWVLLFFIPIANIVFLVMMLNGISKNFGKEEGFTVGLVFLQSIFFAILGYGDAVYLAPKTRTNDSVLDD